MVLSTIAKEEGRMLVKGVGNVWLMSSFKRINRGCEGQPVVNPIQFLRIEED